MNPDKDVRAPLARQLGKRATQIIDATIAMKKVLRLRVRFIGLPNPTENNHDYRQKGSSVAEKSF